MFSLVQFRSISTPIPSLLVGLMAPCRPYVCAAIFFRNDLGRDRVKQEAPDMRTPAARSLHHASTERSRSGMAAVGTEKVQGEPGSEVLDADGLPLCCPQCGFSLLSIDVVDVPQEVEVG